MANISTRDAKLVQYLNEAYGRERQLETSLQAHIQMTTRAPYKKRLQQHLRETKDHARTVQRRIKELGGKAETVSVPGPEVVTETAARVQEVAQRGAALAQGPLHAVRGTGEAEKQLKNAKTEYSDEAAEIAMYSAIETLATTVGDPQTAQLARNIGRQEQRMAGFLERLIPTLTKAVAQAEIPPAERNGATTRRRRPSTAGRKRATTARGRGSTARRRKATTAARRRSPAGQKRRATRPGARTKSRSR